MTSPVERPARTAPSPADELVERMGLLWELEGLSRIAGRILGHLLLQAEACSLDQLAADLQVSKASVSVDARRLESLGLVERVGRAGDRRDYYQIASDMFARSLELKLESVRRFQDTLAAARRIPGTAPAVRDRLAAWERMHEGALRAMESLLDDLRAGSAVAPASADRRTS